jgi:hypothetical protein
VYGPMSIWHVHCAECTFNKDVINISLLALGLLAITNGNKTLWCFRHDPDFLNFINLTCHSLINVSQLNSNKSNLITFFTMKLVKSYINALIIIKRIDNFL